MATELHNLVCIVTHKLSCEVLTHGRGVAHSRWHSRTCFSFYMKSIVGYDHWELAHMMIVFIGIYSNFNCTHIFSQLNTIIGKLHTQRSFFVGIYSTSRYYAHNCSRLDTVIWKLHTRWSFFVGIYSSSSCTHSCFQLDIIIEKLHTQGLFLVGIYSSSSCTHSYFQLDTVIRKLHTRWSFFVGIYSSFSCTHSCFQLDMIIQKLYTRWSFLLVSILVLIAHIFILSWIR